MLHKQMLDVLQNVFIHGNVTWRPFQGTTVNSRSPKATPWAVSAATSLDCLEDLLR